MATPVIRELDATGPEVKTSLRVAVLLEASQLSDVIGADILSNLSTEAYQAIVPFDPMLVPFSNAAIDMEFFYVASTLEPTSTFSGSFRYAPNTTYDACPRDLDIVLIGGPLPNHRPAAADKFMREAWKNTPVFMSTCTGTLWLASTGVLDGHQATTNRNTLQLARKFHPNVNWLDQRWVIDAKPGPGGTQGELWTAGGARCGKNQKEPFKHLYDTGFNDSANFYRN